MVKITSKNRTQARRLLNNWHESKTVAFWSVQELRDKLMLAINQGLITEQGVDRALSKEQAPPRGRSRNGDGENTPIPEDERQPEGESDGESGDGQGEQEGESDSESEESESEGKGGESEIKPG